MIAIAFSLICSGWLDWVGNSWAISWREQVILL